MEVGTVTITVEDGRLWVELGWDPGKVELLPRSETEFFSRGDGTELTFVREKGRIVAFEVFGNRATTSAKWPGIVAPSSGSVPPRW